MCVCACVCVLRARRRASRERWGGAGRGAVVWTIRFPHHNDVIWIPPEGNRMVLTRSPSEWTDRIPHSERAITYGPSSSAGAAAD